MGQSQSLSTQIEIAATPETFLDFQRYKEWHQTFSITSLDPGKQPMDLKPGDRLEVDIKGFSFKSTVVENSPECFQWLGSVPVLFHGAHQFHFSHSQETPGGTTLVQKEDFTGLLAFMMRPGWRMEKQSRENFNALNRDLKAAAEKVAS
ncbi:hypothetical protein DL768_011688 [Monosporascus sp. mg162]|nr:hypothetical protein DL768_011688 [Monosporascus sp. mg162]